MSSWNAVGELLEDTDLILVAREMQIVEMCQDPEPLLGALKHFCLEEMAMGEDGRERRRFAGLILLRRRLIVHRWRNSLLPGPRSLGPWSGLVPGS